eukprot:scaffold41196_cov153-Skeletonema_marinoi.AAC.1
MSPMIKIQVGTLWTAGAKKSRGSNQKSLLLPYPIIFFIVLSTPIKLKRTTVQIIGVASRVLIVHHFHNTNTTNRLVTIIQHHIIFIIMSSATKKPSLYARKLIDKLRTLNSNASLESRQTLANWMVFNRKKAEGMSEGMLLAISTTTTAGDEDPSSARLMLLLRVLHQVFIEGKDDSEAFEKAAQLRSILADVALIPLFQALATSCCSNNNTSSNEQQREKYTTEVKEMIESWKEYSVFDGPTVWEGYKKAWGRAVTDAAVSKEVVVGGSESDSKAATTPPVVETTSTNDDDAVMDVVMGGQSSTEEAAASSTTEIKTNKEEDTTMKEATSIAEPQILPPSSSTTTTKAASDNNNTKGPTEHHPSTRLSKRDSMTSVASIDIDFDAEGVEEAEVEPAKFLEASKVIASLQIARGAYF